MKRLIYTHAKSAVLEDVDMKPVAKGMLSIEMLYTAISRGTESLVFQGLVPESEWERMCVPYQYGSFDFPIGYGYSAVGRVVDGNNSLLGKTGFFMHPHQSHCVVHDQDFHILPDELPSHRAILAANMETALNGIWDSGLNQGDRCVVVGGGVIGLLVAYLAKILHSADVTLIDINPERERVCLALGIRFTLPNDAPHGCNIVFHTSANEIGLQTALQCAGFEATVVEMSWYGSKDVSVPLGGSFHSQRLTLKSSQVGHIAPSHRAQWTYKRRIEKALSLLCDETLDCLLEEPIPFNNICEQLDDVLLSNNGTLCQGLKY